MWRARSCRSGRAGAGTRGTATLGAASPLLRGLGAPHDRAGGYLRQDPAPCRASASSRRNQGRRAEEDPSLGFRGRKESWREPERRCTSLRSFPFESSGVVSVF